MEAPEEEWFILVHVPLKFELLQRDYRFPDDCRQRLWQQPGMRQRCLQDKGLRTPEEQRLVAWRFDSIRSYGAYASLASHFGMKSDWMQIQGQEE